MELEYPPKREMAPFWTAKTEGAFRRLLQEFWENTHGDFWVTRDHGDYAKACLISNAVELGLTELLPDGWLEEWGRDLSWIKRERWANLDRLAPLEAPA